MADDWGNDPIQNVPAVATQAAPSQESWGNDPVVGSKKFRFSDDAIKQAINTKGSTVVMMDPKTYLSLTPDLPDNPKTDRKGASLKKSLDNGDEVDEVPSLNVNVGKDGTAKVVDQDGRHRALFAQQNGLDQIPVRIQHGGQQALITKLAGMKDGSEPIPYDFKPVLPPATPAPPPSKPILARVGDAVVKGGKAVLSDIGKAGEAAATATGQDLKAAFPDPTKMDTNPLASVERLGNAIKAPLDAAGILAAPVTGTAHAVAENTVGRGLAKIAPIPGHDPAADADQMVDSAMMGLGPEGMEGGVAGITAAADAARAAKIPAQQGNTLAKVQNLKPGAVEARQAGYVLPPAMAKVQPSAIESLASGSGGKIKLQQGASVRNQEVTNRLAAEDMGLPGDTPLTKKAYEDVRKPAIAAYKAVANSIPEIVTDQAYKDNVASAAGRNSAANEQFPGLMKNDELDALVKNAGGVEKFTPDAGLEVVRKLRKDAVGNLKALGDPNKTALGLAQRKVADEIDNLIERNLAAAGKGDLVKEYRGARQLLAKSHDLEGATNTATGDVSAIGLARLANKGKPLTGKMKIIADTANAFPKAMQNTAAFGGDEAYSALDAFGAIGSVAAGHPGAAAAIVARPGVRNLLLSHLYQNRMIPDATQIEGLASRVGNAPMAPSGGVALLNKTPLPGVQNQIAKGVHQMARVNGLRTMMNAAQAAAAQRNSLAAITAAQPPAPSPQDQ